MVKSFEVSVARMKHHLHTESLILRIRPYAFTKPDGFFTLAEAMSMKVIVLKGLEIEGDIVYEGLYYGGMAVLLGLKQKMQAGELSDRLFKKKFVA